MYAKDVAVGDVLSYFDGVTFKTSPVKSTSVSLKSGLFNPYTHSGSIVVDGVVASCHSSWILDGVLAPRIAAEVYQRLFVVPRLAYKILGAEGMENVFRVGNAGATASIAQQTAMLIGACVALGLVVRKALRA